MQALLWFVRYMLVVILLVPTGALSDGDIAQAKGEPFTVVSYNIRIGAGLTDFGRSPYRLKDEIALDVGPVVDAIRSLAPDVVGLQEVLGDGQASAIAAALGMHYAYVPHGLERYGAWWGVAILSRWPIKAAFRDEISSGRGNTRANLVATIGVAGVDTHFVVIHKDRDQKNGSPLRHTMKTIDALAPPVLLIGDLNIKPNDKRQAIVSPRLEDSILLAKGPNAAFAKTWGTYLGKNQKTQGKRIDYILLDKGFFSVLDAGLVDQQYWAASDHIAYYTKIQFK